MWQWLLVIVIMLVIGRVIELISVGLWLESLQIIDKLLDLCSYGIRWWCLDVMMFLHSMSWELKSFDDDDESSKVLMISLSFHFDNISDYNIRCAVSWLLGVGLMICW